MKCLVCEKSFERTGTRQKYCSLKCQSASRRKGSNCSRCGSNFMATKKGQKLCFDCRSEKCHAPGCEQIPSESIWRFKLGYCNPHYLRFKSYGNPLAGNPSPSVLVALDHKDGTRTCSRCSERKPIKDFYTDKLATLGRRSYCKECQKAGITANYQKDPEKKKAYQIQHRVDNLAKIRASDSVRYERDKEKRITLAEAHGHIRRARKMQTPYEPGITRIALRKIHGDACFYCGIEMAFGRAKNREFKSSDATIEHRLPLSRGGKHVWENVVLACRECNLSKNQKTEDEFVLYSEKLRVAKNKSTKE